MYNTIISIGHLVKDPETRTTSTGKPICSFRMCISESYNKTKCFIDVETWEKTAEACQKYLTKGRETLVEGELCVSEWTNKEGKKQSKYFIKAAKVKFLSSGQKDGDKASGDSAPQSSAPSDDDDIPF
jgi:single-strand DNA-binding protein